jgi:glutamate dehydrogenase
MPEGADKVKEPLLTRAAQAWRAGEMVDNEANAGQQAAPGVSDAAAFLSAYYRYVAPEDLTAAGPERMAAVAMQHAAIGGRRPQGRAIVTVRDAGSAALDGGGTVLDIVTDDMPYLVDSVTTELNRQGADIHLIVHPVLNVRRNVAGDLHSTTVASDAELTESWIHVEIGRVDDPEALASDLRRVLDDVRVAMEDQRRMRSAVQHQPGEAGALLGWLADGHFIFLGFREYTLGKGQGEAGGGEFRPVPGTGLGILRHDRDGVDAFGAAGQAPAPDDKSPLILTKASVRSTVYRPSYLDYIAVRIFGDNNEVTGEYRFLGLYTQAAYSESITRIPVLRDKLATVLRETGLNADSHDGKALTEMLEGYPREELFETSADQLTPIALGVLRLRERRRPRVFLRPDPYGRYTSCLVYLPRDRYTTQVRLRTQEILRTALGGTSVDYSAMVGNSALARLHVVVHAAPGHPLAKPDPATLERAIAAIVRSWDEDLAEDAIRRFGEAKAAMLMDTCARGIPEVYKTDTEPTDATEDLNEVLTLREAGAPFGVKLVFTSDEQWRLRVYRLNSPVTLTEVLPQLQHMGVDVVDEHPYEFSGVGDRCAPYWIYDFGLQRGRGAETSSRELFEAAITALWNGQIEDDAFNALVLDAGLTWREVVLLRGYARYLRQAGARFSQDYLQRVLRSNPRITRLLVRLFESRFDPDKQGGATERCDAISEEVRGALDEVTSLDQDRILRSYLALIEATLRTNYYQGDPATLALKLDPTQVPNLPAPRPKFEIFVYSPRLEAVHLRFGRVARGGLRWSDREEDFRTEVLGLVKAQQVKNSVIVPAGAKGGFVCKQLPAPDNRMAYQAEVLACYQTFIGAMLDITDNLVDGKVVPPMNVVRRDGDDPYLVVAADKGTATFSDAANAIAARYNFWLGDAFASGGSVGYDHKKMGITARGAWEAVRWHFATLGMNPDTDDFTVAGIGDMSGDVFGNGMLLSEHIKLIAAFDHRHIFLDPDPIPAVSFAERQRMFNLERSSWADYNPGLISAGGGVWPRSVKSIPLSPQARAALGIDSGVTAMSPDELISAILSARVDLLWNGGIGTYVKASNETHADAGDRSNDAVRVDAPQLRARVVAEGGNLGLTQAGRIEFARGGGLINTDFIDNSAGVDTSDHEVNIKVLLGSSLEAQQRGRLLHEMTDEVAAHVLRHNDGQNMALAAARAQAPALLHVHARYLRKLVRDGRLSAETDELPGEKEIAERRGAGEGLTTPELAVLLAHTKIAADEDVLASELPDDPFMNTALVDYFPAPLRQDYTERMSTHPLRREIISTVVVNEMVDTSGITFLFRLNEETGASVADMTRAWLVAREVFGMTAFWERVASLAGQVDSATRIAMVLEGRKLMERACRWLLLNRRPPLDISATVRFFAEGVAAVLSVIPKCLTGRDLAGYAERRESFASRGVPADLAEQVAAMVPAYSAFDIVQSADACGCSVQEAAEVYFDLADRLQINRLRDRIVALPRDDRWASMARSALRDDLYAAHAALTRDVLRVGREGEAGGGSGSPEERLVVWAAHNEAPVDRAAQTLGEIWESERFTFATLSVATRAIRTLVAVSSLPADPAR